MADRARHIFPAVALVAGTVLGLILVAVVFVVRENWAHSDAWDAPAMMERMDCSGVPICRHFPNQVMQVRDGAGGSFEVRSNALGFRGAELPPVQRPPGHVLVQMYGDSMIHGTGVEEDETIAANLRRMLTTADRPVHVMNFGMPMNYLGSQLAIYEHWGRAFDPDVIVLEYHGSIPSPRDINFRVRQIRESALATLLFRFAWGRTLINRYQTWQISRYSQETALAALRPGVELLARDQRDRGMGVAVFSFRSEFGELDQIFPADLDLAKIASGLRGWEEYRDSDFIIPGDGHPNPAGTRYFAGRIADAVLPLIADRGLPAISH